MIILVAGGSIGLTSFSQRSKRGVCIHTVRKKTPLGSGIASMLLLKLLGVKHDIPLLHVPWRRPAVLYLGLLILLGTEITHMTRYWIVFI